MSEFRAHWTSEQTWRDPDCVECGGEGAPCCDPPYGTPPSYEALCAGANRLLDALLAYGVPGGETYNAWWALRYLLEGNSEPRPRRRYAEAVAPWWTAATRARGTARRGSPWPDPAGRRPSSSCSTPR